MIQNSIHHRSIALSKDTSKDLLSNSTKNGLNNIMSYRQSDDMKSLKEIAEGTCL